MSYNFDFDEISFCDDPSLIQNVSMMRHYINCHGINKKLIKYLGLDNKTISTVYSNCIGSTNIFDIINNTEEEIEKSKKIKNNKNEALKKNKQLIQQLSDKRKTMCGVGTRKIKCMLNSLLKKGDKIAELYRTALEIEDENIKAKDNAYYAETHYYKKEQLIYKLIDLCNKENIVYGIQTSDVRDTNKIIYFELPNCEQISWHCNMKENIVNKCSQYDKDWDRKVNSTLDKLERSILDTYGEIINQKYMS